MTARLSPDELGTLEQLLRKLDGPGADLPWPLFRFITEVSATANVDLLVHDGAGQVLLAWREDPFGAGWHVPGSIIRHREEIAHRLDACAADEFGCPVDVSPHPVALLQIFDDRGHSVSLVHPATLRGTPAGLAPEGTPEPGALRWFAAVPPDLYPSHEAYRNIIAAFRAGTLSAAIPVFTERTGHREKARPTPGGCIAADTSLTEGA